MQILRCIPTLPPILFGLVAFLLLNAPAEAQINIRVNIGSSCTPVFTPVAPCVRVFPVYTWRYTPVLVPVCGTYYGRWPVGGFYGRTIPSFSTVSTSAVSPSGWTAGAVPSPISFPLSLNGSSNSDSASSPETAAQAFVQPSQFLRVANSPAEPTPPTVLPEPTTPNEANRQAPTPIQTDPHSTFRWRR